MQFDNQDAFVRANSFEDYKKLGSGLVTAKKIELSRNVMLVWVMFNPMDVVKNYCFPKNGV